MSSIFDPIATGFEAFGASAMIVGAVMAVVLAIRALRRGQGGGVAFHTLRQTFGGGILLGLEILVAADLIRTITSPPSMEDALILGVIVLIRTVLSMSIEIEMDGVLPWKKAALLNSGGQVIAQQVKKDRVAAEAAHAATVSAPPAPPAPPTPTKNRATER